ELRACVLRPARPAAAIFAPAVRSERVSAESNSATNFPPQGQENPCLSLILRRRRCVTQSDPTGSGPAERTPAAGRLRRLSGVVSVQNPHEPATSLRRVFLRRLPVPPLSVLSDVQRVSRAAHLGGAPGAGLLSPVHSPNAAFARPQWLGVGPLHNDRH